ncbi:phosphohistidine phosphatase SixA [Arsukibacterium indicum]|uniref:Phosphohistidine phosphatase SixA n=1 Tax=Arsukibacterium indicum TaxID=2848612 RepID=A0ABS6MFZ9_9GAMM|nr:phosphohistidine phosphatase SixA [Arsukibacterium indicum]MBV2127660.1 phosphohistidine phosphatase SixA [Arsukibacterium indicum]
MVNIVIMRHGEAEPLIKHDSQRQLTTRGKREALQMAQWLQNCYSAFDELWVSPYLRASQTAEIMLSKQGPDCLLQTCSNLVPDGSPLIILNLIDAKLAAEPDAKILLVSHMPLVSFLVESLTQPGQTPVFSTSSLCCIDYQPGKSGRLLEKVAPQDLALIST